MSDDDVHAASSEQLTLLRDAARARARVEDVPPRHEGRVAVVWPMLEVPHLDREFEYSVPEVFSEDVRFGVAVRVRFHGKRITGYVVDVREEAAFTGTLSPILDVVSPEAVLTAHVWQVAQQVAETMAGSVSDVLRLAVPPRHARAQKALDEREERERIADAAARDGEADGSEPEKVDDRGLDSPGVEGDGHEDAGASEATNVRDHCGTEAAETNPWRFYAGGLSLLTHLAAGEAPRGSWDVAPGLSDRDAWPSAVAEAAAATRASGRSSVIVLPDARDVDRVLAACVARLGAERVTRLSADQGPQARYTAYLKALRGMADVVVGTRSAMFAPVRDLGLVAWWDDADTVLVDPHAPYPHVGVVLELRAAAAGAGSLSVGAVPSARVQQQVERGVIVPVEPVSRTGARIVVTGEDLSVERHGPAARARIPAEAWQGARAALERGPVLVQVPRRGYIPTLACARCREKATCDVCHGPLGLPTEGGAPTCRWCGHVAHVHTCPACGSHELRSLTIGAGRTADELGRAFTGVPVRRSGAPDILAEVADEPALVIATPGAEPVAPHGYAAAILLDAWALLDRGGLESGQRALTHWSTAAALVRPADAGGVVYLAGVPRHVPFPPVEALVRSAPRWFAARDLAERAEAMLPPITRMAAIEGPRRAAAGYAETLRSRAAEAELALNVLGPLPLGRRHHFDRGPRHVPASPAAAALSHDADEVAMRYLARWNDPADLRYPRLLRALTASRAAAREPAVTVRLDPLLDGLG